MPAPDVIVVGSGMTGGWAAKELTERGFSVLLIERGPNLRHRIDYKNEFKAPWEMPFRGFGDPQAMVTSKRIQKYAREFDEWNLDYFVDDDVDIYETPPESGFRWIRGYHLGGRSVMWGRHSYRMAPVHFESNAKDGNGIPWPVRYEDVAPWYDHVEKFIGVNGTQDGDLPGLPQGIYQPSMGFNAAEQKLADLIHAHYPDRKLLPGRTANLTEPIGAERMACHNRNQCRRGCSFGAYFSSQSSTLPAATATGRLTIQTDTIVDSLEIDPSTGRATGVRCIDALTGAGSTLRARTIFLCAGSVNSIGILQRSASERAPGGVGNSSGLLGRYFMDHCFGGLYLATVPGLDDQMYSGRKPNGIVMPRFVNIKEQETDFLRGYSLQGASGREAWKRGGHEAGIGVALKTRLEKPGGWLIGFGVSVENIPRRDNLVRVNFNRRDKYGLPLMHIDVRWSDNELKAAAHGRQQMQEMLSLLGGHIIPAVSEPQPPGTTIHEIGGACMGHDPRGSVTNAWNQVHDAPNVFVADGAAMCSGGDRNTSLSLMALTARAAAHAADLLRNGAV